MELLFSMMVLMSFFTVNGGFRLNNLNIKYMVAERKREMVFLLSIKKTV